MGENKHIKELDAFAKKYVKEIPQTKPSIDFTAAIMNTIVAEKLVPVSKGVPLISKKIVFASLSFVAICIWTLFKERNTSNLQFPTIDVSFISKLEIPNVFSAVSISSTIMYAVVVFSVMVFIQIAFLKNYFEKKYQ